MARPTYIYEGDKIGSLTALEDIPRARSRGRFLCDCGIIVSKEGRVVKSGHDSCGCKFFLRAYMGEQYNQWTALSDGKSEDLIDFRCSCGVIKTFKSNYIVSGSSKSCGHDLKHGKKGDRVYTIWMGMKQRCTNPNSVAWGYYGGRGIGICDKWMDFQGFYEDMGDPPSEYHEIDRVDVNQRYSVENCRWVDRIQNANNRTDNRYLTAFGETKSMADWARDERCRVGYGTLSSRMRSGWDPYVAISTEPLKGSQNVRI